MTTVKDQATETLFAGRARWADDLSGAFDNAHEVTSFNDLRADRYGHDAHASELAPETLPLNFMTNTPDNNDTASQLFATQAATNMSKATAQVARQESEMSQYYTPDRAVSQEQMQAHAARQAQAYEFRPTIYDENLRPIDTTQVHQIAEYDVGEVGYSVREEAGALDMQGQEETTTEEVTSLRLNTRGMIAVGAFFAVLVLVTVLIIINAVSLGSSGARIQALQTENTALTQELNNNIDARNILANDRIDELQRQLDTYGSYNGQVFSDLPPATQLPPIPTLRPLPNPDHSTNWFNNVSQWLSGLFR